MRHPTIRRLTLCVAAVLAGLAAASAPAAGVTVFADDFDAHATGSPPGSPWEEGYTLPFGVPITRAEAASYGVTVMTDETVFFGPSGKSVHFLDLSGPGGAAARLLTEFDPVSVLTLDYYMRTDDPAAEGILVDLGGDAGTDYVVAFGNASGGGHAGQIGVLSFQHGWVEPDLMPYTPGLWYHVRRTLDLEAGEGAFLVEEVGNPANPDISPVSRRQE
jgi:hypothetical protein